MLKETQKQFIKEHFTSTKGSEFLADTTTLNPSEFEEFSNLFIGETHKYFDVRRETLSLFIKEDWRDTIVNELGINERQ